MSGPIMFVFPHLYITVDNWPCGVCIGRPDRSPGPTRECRLIFFSILIVTSCYQSWWIQCCLTHYRKNTKWNSAKTPSEMPQKYQVAEARGANMSDFMMHLKGVFCRKKHPCTSSFFGFTKWFSGFTKWFLRIVLIIREIKIRITKYLWFIRHFAWCGNNAVHIASIQSIVHP